MPKRHYIQEVKDRSGRKIGWRKLGVIIQDIIGKSHKWPKYYRELFFESKKLYYKTRFTLVIFLLGNGVNPDLIYQYLDSKFDFDGAADKQILSVISQYPTSNWKTWDMMAQKYR